MVVLEQDDRARVVPGGCHRGIRERVVCRPVSSAPRGQQRGIHVGAVSGREHPVLEEPKERVRDDVVIGLEDRGIEAHQVEPDVLVREHGLDQVADDGGAEARPARRAGLPAATTRPFSDPAQVGEHRGRDAVALGDRDGHPAQRGMPAQLAEGGHQAPGPTRRGQPDGRGGVVVEGDGPPIGDDDQATGGSKEIIQHPRSVDRHASSMPDGSNRAPHSSRTAIVRPLPGRCEARPIRPRARRSRRSPAGSPGTDPARS